MAAVVGLTLDPPNGVWSLIGTALAAGVGGEAILLAILASRKADRAEQETKQAHDLNGRLLVASRSQMKTLARVGARLGESGAGPALEARSFRALRDDAGSPAAGTVLDTLADGLVRDLSVFAAAAVAPPRPGTLLQRVRSVLVEVLDRDDVDDAQLRDIGGDEPHRNMIVEELNVEFPRSRPSFEYGDVKPPHTLDTLTVDVEGRQP